MQNYPLICIFANSVVIMHIYAAGHLAVPLQLFLTHLLFNLVLLLSRETSWPTQEEDDDDIDLESVYSQFHAS